MVARNLLLDGNELSIVGGQLRFASGTDSIRQAIELRLKTVRGEWFLDPTVGVPYYEAALGQKPTSGVLSLLRSVLREQLLAIPGVKDVLELQVRHDRPSRLTTLTYRVSTDLGELEGMSGVGSTVAEALATAAPSGTTPGPGESEMLLTFTSETRPVASASWLNRFIVVKDAGLPGEIQFCRQTADGGYEWIVVGF